jgi:hypothetical protein
MTVTFVTKGNERGVRHVFGVPVGMLQVNEIMEALFAYRWWLYVRTKDRRVA